METNGNGVVSPKVKQPPRLGASRPRGQAMILFLVLSGVLCLGVILLFNTGQGVNKKVQLVNTADAAAYSVAVQQARVMNYAAYMNRGRIANEVAIAQLVSLWSWMNMLHTHTVAGYNLFWVLSKIPYVNVVATPLMAIYKAAETGVSVARGVIHPAADLAITSLDFLNGVLAGSAETMLRVGSTVDGVKIAMDVVEKNDLTAKISPLGYAFLVGQLRDAASTTSGGLLDGFKRPKNASARNPGMDRYRNVVMASRDWFSADRADEIGIPFIDIEVAGGTDMVDYGRWAGLDTLDLSIGIDIGPIDWTLDVPLGWGGAQAVKDKNKKLPGFFPGIESGGSNQKGKGWYSEYHSEIKTYEQYGGATNSTAKLAEQYPSVDAPFAPMKASGSLTKKKDAYFSGYDGLRDYQDVKAKYGQSPEGDDAGPVFTVYVESARKNARTSEDTEIGVPAGGQLELKNRMSDEKMTAISSAQVYFNRPPADKEGLFRRLVPGKWNGDPANDGQLEMGSLFSPYWQARLIDTPKPIYAAIGIKDIVTGAP